MAVPSRQQQKGPPERGHNCIISALPSTRKVSPKPKASSLPRPRCSWAFCSLPKEAPKPCFHYSTFFRHLACSYEASPQLLVGRASGRRGKRTSGLRLGCYRLGCPWSLPSWILHHCSPLDSLPGSSLERPFSPEGNPFHSPA